LQKNTQELLVLLVEDHRLLAQTLIEYFACEDIETDYAADGLQGLNMARENTYDAIVLDVMLPSLDGFSLCKSIRQDLKIDTPIIMLTARDELDDKLEGFDHGADDYVVKPFEQQELVARVASELVVGELRLDKASRQAWRQKTMLELSPTSFAILNLLMRESPNVVSRESLHQELWGSEPPDTDALRSHVYRR